MRNLSIAEGKTAILTVPASEPSPLAVQPDVLLDTFFTRCHGKPFHIIDEASIRQRIQLNQIPSYLVFAIYAVSSRWVHLNAGNALLADNDRFAAHPNGYHASVRMSEDYALRARTELDIDDPSMDTLQALLLLEVAFTAAGKGKKAYMMLCAYTGSHCSYLY